MIRALARRRQAPDARLWRIAGRAGDSGSRPAIVLARVRDPVRLRDRLCPIAVAVASRNRAEIVAPPHEKGLRHGVVGDCRFDDGASRDAVSTRPRGTAPCSRFYSHLVRIGQFAAPAAPKQKRRIGCSLSIKATAPTLRFRARDDNGEPRQFDDDRNSPSARCDACLSSTSCAAAVCGEPGPRWRPGSRDKPVAPSARAPPSLAVVLISSRGSCRSSSRWPAARS